VINFVPSLINALTPELILDLQNALVQRVVLVVVRHIMKFGRKITVRHFCEWVKWCTKPVSPQTNLYDEWRPFYIDYNLLKRELKVTPSPNCPTHPHPLYPHSPAPPLPLTTGTTKMNVISPPCSKRSSIKFMISRNER
jgi:hypothetical protein